MHGVTGVGVEAFDIAFQLLIGDFYVLSDNGLMAHINGIMSQYVYMSDMRQRVMEAKKLTSLTPLSVTVRCGEWSATFFIDPTLADVAPFYYLNCFGVVEQLPLQRTTTEKAKSDRSVATLSRALRFYDVSTSKEYEVESAPLTSDECLQVEQLFTSPTVRIPFGIYSVLYKTDFDALATILTTDFTSEISDTDESSACRFRSVAEKELRRLYPRIEKLYLPVLQFLRRLAQCQNPYLR